MIQLLVLLLLVVSGYKRADYITDAQFTKARKIVLKAHIRPNGTWLNMYTGRVVKVDDSLDIDHIIPLKYADGRGMAERALVERRAFGVDTLNLVQVGRHENRSKGDDGPSEYMPKVNKCFYTQRWYAIADKYQIKIDSADSVILSKTIKMCR